MIRGAKCGGRQENVSLIIALEALFSRLTILFRVQRYEEASTIQNKMYVILFLLSSAEVARLKVKVENKV